MSTDKISNYDLPGYVRENENVLNAPINNKMKRVVQENQSAQQYVNNNNKTKKLCNDGMR